MTVRTEYATVVFREPFVLAGFDEELAAGTYKIETDKELLDTILSVSWRRLRTRIRLHPDIAHPGEVRILTVAPVELDAALARDHRGLEGLPNATTRHGREETEDKTGQAGNSG